MPTTGWRQCSLLLPAWICAVGAAQGQAYPNKPIRFVTQAAGGGSDYALRIIAPAISIPLGQAVLVENRPGNVAIPAEVVARAAPDGYTILYVGNSFWTAPLLQKSAYDPVKDYAPITMATGSPTVMVVHPSLPVKSVKELIALAKAMPGQLNYASGVVGGAGHLAGELFNTMAGVRIVHVSYKSSGGAALTDLLSGQTQMAINNGPLMLPHIKGGRLRALAVTSAQPSALFPGLPTVAASLPGYESIQVNVVFAPAKTPDAVVTRLNQEIVRFLRSPEAQERFFSAGTEVIASTPGELAAAMKADIARSARVIKAADIKGE